MSGQQTHLLDLPFECLLKLCDEMDCYDLVEFMGTCGTFEAVIAHRAKELSQRMLMVTHHPHSFTNMRNCTDLSFYERFVIGSNWIKGDYMFRSYCPFQNSTLALDKEYLYTAMRSHVVKFKRFPNVTPGADAFDATNDFNFITKCTSSITDFAVKGDTIFEVRTTGEGHIHEQNVYKEFKLYPDSDVLLSCDFHGKLYVACTNDKTNIWVRDEEPIPPNLQEMHSMRKGYMTICLNQQGNVLFGGSQRVLDKLDIESMNLTNLHSNTQDFFQIQNKDEQSLLALSSENLFLFDDRCNSVSQKLAQTSYMSCFDYDGVNSVVLGLKYDAGIKLMDMRKFNSIVQTYYSNYHGGGVNALVCDTRYLFGNWNKRINYFDFKKSF